MPPSLPTASWLLFPITLPRPPHYPELAQLWNHSPWRPSNPQLPGSMSLPSSSLSESHPCSFSSPVAQSLLYSTSSLSHPLAQFQTWIHKVFSSLECLHDHVAFCWRQLLPSWSHWSWPQESLLCLPWDICSTPWAIAFANLISCS